jgi:hypothetical protein
MVLFKREVRLWRETNVTQRALMIRDDADFAWLAIQMQHDRIVNGAYPPPGKDARLHLFRQKTGRSQAVEAIQAGGISAS